MNMQGARTGGPNAIPAQATDPAQSDALLQLVQRINAVLEEEGRLLGEGPSDDFDRIIARKNHLALEMARFAANVGPLRLDAAARLTLQEAKVSIADNASVLQRNIDAVGEILTMVSDVLNRSQSDGTYTYDAMRRSMKK